MEKTRTSKKLWFVVSFSFLLAIALSLTVSAAYLNASIRNLNTNVIENVYYYTAGEGYKDNVGGYPPIKLEVCADTSGELAGTGAAAFYAVAPTNSSLFLYDLLGGDTVPHFVPMDVPFASGSDYCAYANFSFYAGRSPYPAKIFVAVDVDGDDGVIIEPGDPVIPVTAAEGYLPYGYSRNDVQASYNQVTGNVTIDATATNPGVAKTSSTMLLVGSCEDDQGVYCNGTVRTSVAAAGVSVFTGVVAPPDSVKYTKQSVINGYGAPYCIGPDVDVLSVNVVPNVGPSGTLTTLSAVVKNVNTVDVTTNFNVDLYRGPTVICTLTLTAPLAAGATKTTSSCNWNVVGSGSLTIVGTPLDAAAGIADCNDGDDNGTGVFTTETVWIPRVWIDGNETNVFPDAGRPYNLTVFINNSDGGTPPVLLRLVEENGMSVFAPTQLYTLNIGDSGVISKAISQVITDDTGFISFAVVPTGTKLYNPEYAYLNVSSYVGNHSIYFEIFNNATGAELQLFFNGSKQDDFPFVLTNLSPRTPNATEKRTLVVINQNSLVKEALDLTYKSLATAVRWLK
ncbi:MAG: hypothetical protein NTW67_01575 [Candidatus Woesearchaeota archaeon]|nr:hypothetical protein [Candidatus Woesearchaeota archaeon]